MLDEVPLSPPVEVLELLEQITGYSELTINKAALVDLDYSMVFIAALFLLLFYILNKTFIQPMLNVFDKRHALTGGARDEAARAVKSAEDRIASYEAQVGEARRSAAAEQKRFRIEGLDREREVLATVRKEADAKITAGINELISQASAAEAELEATAKGLGQAIAARVLGGTG